ncbi:MAG: hypothetical protein K2P51_04085 [Rhabdochlamydiaceae bacterium]|nr:hypothetical protein [Rhabdochlamydiaceae bacterium]
MALSGLDPQKFHQLGAFYDDFKHHSKKLNDCKTTELITIFERYEKSFINLKYETKTLLKQIPKFSLENNSQRASLLQFIQKYKKIHEAQKNLILGQLPSAFDSATKGPINTKVKERIRVLKMTKTIERKQCLAKSEYKKTIYSNKRSTKLTDLEKKNNRGLEIAQQISMSRPSIKKLQIKQKKSVENFEVKTQKKLRYLDKAANATSLTIENELKILTRALKGKYTSSADVHQALKNTD